MFVSSIFISSTIFFCQSRYLVLIFISIWYFCCRMLISLMDLMYICFLFPQGVNLDTLTDEEKFPEKNNFNNVKYNNLNLETNV